MSPVFRISTAEPNSVTDFDGSGDGGGSPAPVRHRHEERPIIPRVVLRPAGRPILPTDFTIGGNCE